MKFNNIINEMGSASANTSIKQVSAGLKKLDTLIDIKDNHVNLDWGGGKYDLGTEYLNEKGITNLVYDEFNRKDAHNNRVLRSVRKRKADSATLLNVLNVIEDKKERIEAVKEPLKYVKNGGNLIIAVYEGDKKGELKKTIKGWQMNQPIKFYQNELEEAGFNVRKKGRYLIIKN